MGNGRPCATAIAASVEINSTGKNNIGVVGVNTQNEVVPRLFSGEVNIVVVWISWDGKRSPSTSTIARPKKTRDISLSVAADHIQYIFIAWGTSQFHPISCFTKGDGQLGPIVAAIG